jgi:hypothetical protein
MTESIYDMYVNATTNALLREYLHIFIHRVYVDDRKIVKLEFMPVIEKLIEIEQVRIRNKWRRVRDSNS